MIEKSEINELEITFDPCGLKELKRPVVNTAAKRNLKFVLLNGQKRNII